jgi:hypothetical protein
MKIIKPIIGVAILGMAASLVIATPLNESHIEGMAKDLIHLRGEVEELQAKIDNKKETHKNRMGSLAVQSTDLETQLQRQSLELKQLKTSLIEAQARSSKDSIQGKDLKPLVLNSIIKIKQSIAKGIPFKTGERLAQLNEISDQVELNLLPAHKAVNRLWAFVDDEIRLTKESGIYRQPIKMNGKEILADIARIGMVLMYFQNGENSYGKVVKTDKGWSFVNIHNAEDRDQVIGLFDSLKKQIRTGQFSLPNSLANAEANN